MGVHAFAAQLAVERLDERIIRRLAGPGEVERDAFSRTIAGIRTMNEWRKKAPSGPRKRTSAEVHDYVILALGGILFAILLAWPIYNLTTGSGSRPENFTVLGGAIGLSVATYGVLSNRTHDRTRLPFVLIGLLLVLVCVGFGPL